MLSADELRSLREEVQAVQVEDKMFQYIFEIVRSTRGSQNIAVGASTRAGIALVSSSKALAAIRGRDFVIPDDIKELAMPILRHRILLRAEAEIEGYSVDQVLDSVIEQQVVPR